MTLPSLSYLDLEPGSLSGDMFVPFEIEGLGSPTLDSARPERFGRPNYDTKLFWPTVWTAVQHAGIEPQMLRLHAGAANQPAEPTRLVIFHDDNLITPLLATDETGNLQRWIAALTSQMGNRPVELSKGASQSSAGLMVGWDLMISDPAAWLIQTAPSSWVARRQRPVKLAVLADAAKVAGPPADSDHQQILPLWNELVERSGTTPSPGATDGDFAAFAATTGFELPDGLKTLLRLSNGAAEIFGFRSLMSIEQITTQWVEWNAIFDDFVLEDLQASYKSDNDRTLPMYTTPHWISFADESTGNFAAVDLLPGPAGRRGQIIYFGADEYTIRWLASDVADFLRREIEWSKAGADHNAPWF